MMIVIITHQNMIFFVKALYSRYSISFRFKFERFVSDSFMSFSYPSLKFRNIVFEVLILFNLFSIDVKLLIEILVNFFNRGKPAKRAVFMFLAVIFMLFIMISQFGFNFNMPVEFTVYSFVFCFIQFSLNTILCFIEMKYVLSVSCRTRFEFISVL